MKKCESCNNLDDTLIFVHTQIHELCAQLRSSHWPDHVSDFWESNGVLRLINALSNHPYPKISQHIVSIHMAQLIKDLQNCQRTASFAERNKDWEEKLSHLQMELIPSYFVRKCNKQINALTAINLAHQPKTR